MQTNLEIKAIKKRLTDTVLNSTKTYGVADNKVKGKSSQDGDGYDIYGGDAKKGGESEGSLVNHLNKKFDLTTGGDNVDTKERNKQLAYVIPGINSYSSENIYSDENEIKIDTSLNVGQVVIY